MSGALLGVALLLALGLLHGVAGAGELSLGATALLLLLGPVAAAGPRGRAWREVLAAAFPALALVAVIGVAARGALAPDGPPGLATVARLVALGGAALLPRTAPALYPLQALGVVLVLWTAAALEPGPGPARALVTLLVLVLLAQGMALARSAEARAEATTTAGVGVAPHAFPTPPSPHPALLAAALAALPAGLGLSLPRAGSGLESSAAAERGDERARRGSATEPVRFVPELRLDRDRGALREEDTVVARLTCDPEPPGFFLRGAALPVLTAEGFFPAPAGGGDPPPGSEVAVLLDVTLASSQAGRLLVAGRVEALEDVVTLPVPGGFAAPAGAAYPLRYRARCALPDPPRDELLLLPARRDPRWLEVPPEVRTPALVALAGEAVRGATPAERAEAVVRWLRGRCGYDLRVAARGGSAAARIEAFLLRDKRGVCTEFAAAMAVLLRLAGEPARVCTGYRVAERDIDERLVVRARHAHAWVELPLEGAGWVPFDPTPPFVPGPPAEDPAAAATTAQPEPGATDEGAPASEADATRSAERLAAPALAAAGLLLLILAAGLALASGREAARARLDRLGPVEPGVSWASQRERLFALLVARGFLPGGPDTPLEWAAALPPPAPGQEQARGALARALAAYTELRFGGRAERAADLSAALDGATR